MAEDLHLKTEPARRGHPKRRAGGHCKRDADAELSPSAGEPELEQGSPPTGTVAIDAQEITAAGSSDLSSPQAGEQPRGPASRRLQGRAPGTHGQTTGTADPTG